MSIFQRTHKVSVFGLGEVGEAQRHSTIRSDLGKNDTLGEL